MIVDPCVNDDGRTVLVQHVIFDVNVRQENLAFPDTVFLDSQVGQVTGMRAILGQDPMRAAI